LNLPKIILTFSLSLFLLIGLAGVYKKKRGDRRLAHLSEKVESKAQVVTPVPVNSVKKNQKIGLPAVSAEAFNRMEENERADLVDRLFATNESRLPIVETITYAPRVPWMKGRPAWLADYAAHYNTTRHFIARSLNQKIDYFNQKIFPGDKFNVLKKDVEFYLLVDLSTARMWFYALDTAKAERYLLKTYKVGLGRRDSFKLSGCLTPKGRYLLGQKVALYQPKVMGYFHDRQIEMMRIFGTRWIPFEKELEGASQKARGLGLHGAPWINDPEKGLIEDRERIGSYESDGCIRLYSEDIEELFAIIISKPTVVEIVSAFAEAKLPGFPASVRGLR
jgi:hypothetical protein